MFYHSRVKFGRLNKFTDADRDVWHIEQDLFIPGNILFADGHALKTTDGVNTSIIADSVSKHASYDHINGIEHSPDFTSITAFLQFDKTKVIIVDNKYNCLRLLNRLDQFVRDYIGSCSTAGGYVDGHIKVARFDGPFNVIRDERSPSTNLLVSDLYNRALRSVAIQVESVGTIHRSKAFEAFGMAWENYGDHSILLGGQRGVHRYSLRCDDSRVVAGTASTKWAIDGATDQAELTPVHKIARLTKDLYILTSSAASRLRLLDLDKEMIYSLCVTEDGNKSECQFGSPHSLVSYNGYVYVGVAKAIKRFSGTAILCYYLFETKKLSSISLLKVEEYPTILLI